MTVRVRFSVAGRDGRSIAELLVWLAVAGFFLVASEPFAHARGSYAWGAAPWPRTVAVLLALAALGRFLSRRRVGPAVETGEGGVVGPTPPSMPFLVTVAFVAVLPWTGFYAALPPFILAFLLATGERRPQALAGLSLGGSSVLVGLFTALFFVPLPSGRLTAFHEASGWLVALLT
jgi:hypothetical protein